MTAAFFLFIFTPYTRFSRILFYFFLIYSIFFIISVFTLRLKHLFLFHICLCLLLLQPIHIKCVGCGEAARQTLGWGQCYKNNNKFLVGHNIFITLRTHLLLKFSPVFEEFNPNVRFPAGN